MGAQKKTPSARGSARVGEVGGSPGKGLYELLDLFYEGFSSADFVTHRLHSPAAEGLEFRETVRSSERSA